MSIWWFAGFAAIAALAFVAVTFNELIVARNRTRAAWSDIAVQLQRRHDLIPGLVAAVKGYAEHEQATLVAVTDMRNRAQANLSVAQRSDVENRLGAGISRLVAVGERYPQLKANENFLQLQASLVDTENRLAQARRQYNARALRFNSTIQQFPQMLLARPLGFEPLEFFQADADIQE